MVELGIKELLHKLKMVVGTKKTKSTNSSFIIPTNTEIDRDFVISKNTEKEPNYNYNNCNFESYKEMIDYKNLKNYIDSLYEKQEAEKENKKAR
ncbi:MAG: hypothetical protein KJI71_05240 [Patescibacteria group bacterium]|nr:hypothetical protein [Patescibacteria group bacterium]